MMMWDKKRALSSILSGRKDEDGERLFEPTEMKNEVVKDEDGEIDGRHVAAQDMLSAFHEKSPEKLMHAMGNFIDMHMNYSEPDQDDQE